MSLCLKILLYKELHKKYGVVISCYVYYEDKDFNLTQFLDKYKS